MAKFGINDLLNIKGREAGSIAAKADSRQPVSEVNGYREIWLSPYEVKPSESNFYSQEKIEELADSFLAVGQQQPTVLARVEGEFRIVSGHRRNLANIRNLERGYREYEKVRYLYRDMTPAMLELSLIMGNALNRELTAWEKTRQAQRLKEALIRAREEDGLEIQGKLRDMVADLMNESSTNVARMECINHHASAEIKNEFKKGNLGISAAYEAAKLPLDRQKELAKEVAGGKRVQAKEIKGKDILKDNKSKNGEKPGRRMDKHREILHEWGKAGGRSITVSEAVKDAIQRVSESDIGKEGWTDMEWAVYLANTVVDLADRVSEEDLYLLHDIVIRCQEKEC